MGLILIFIFGIGKLLYVLLWKSFFILFSLSCVIHDRVPTAMFLLCGIFRDLLVMLIFFIYLNCLFRCFSLFSVVFPICFILFYFIFLYSRLRFFLCILYDRLNFLHIIIIFFCGSIVTIKNVLIIFKQYIILNRKSYFLVFSDIFIFLLFLVLDMVSKMYSLIKICFVADNIVLLSLV